MKKYIILLLLFSASLLKADNLRLSYLGEATITYAKPYIYLIEKNSYKTIKIPELTESAPVYFKFSDSTFYKKFTPTSFQLNIIDNKLYITQNLGGIVYEIRGNELVRIDHSFEHKMQINSQQFLYDNRIFRFGGYGFWSARNFFTYFDINSKEWESYSPVQGDKVPPGMFDVNQFKSGEDISYFNGMVLNAFDNLKFERNQDLWHFNLRSKTWENRGKTALFFGNNPQNFQYDNYFVAFNEERKIIRVNFTDDSYEIFQNEAVSSKISPQFKPFVENGIIYYFANNHSNGDIELVSVPIDKFLGNAILKAPFLELNLWAKYSAYIIAIIGLFGCFLVLYFFLKLRPSKATIIKDKDGILYLGKATINFEENELKVLRHLLKKDDVPNSELLELIEQKGVHFSHNIRLKNDVLNQLNLKLKAILQVDTNFIIFKKSDTDSRLKVYRLNKQFFQVSEEFLNS
ncbi:hypothetical protein SKC37_07665 [Aquirufa sp. HETE-83D]|uniref:Uncharacterized protein n=1 Tax=Aquirufa esocilacus TaxID=3096513 RepID=A0ABW6DM04_9BACT